LSLLVSKLSEGKKQAEGMIKRKVLSEAEKKIKEKFDVSGETYEELLESLNEKIHLQTSNVGDQFKKEKEILKSKVSFLESELEKVKSEFERSTSEKVIIDKISPYLQRFEFVTEKVKQMAIQDYLNSRKFINSDGEIFLEIDDKPVAAIEHDFEKHALQYAVLKNQNSPTKKPTSVEISGTDASFGDSISELLKALKTAPVDEREAIKSKIKLLESKMKN